MKADPEVYNFRQSESRLTDVSLYDCSDITGSFLWMEKPKIGFEIPQKKKTTQSASIAVDIAVNIGNHVFTFPKKLSSVAAEVELSKYILDLSNNWDGDDALAINSNIFYAGIKWLHEYSLKLLNKEGIAIKAPEINPTPSGGLHMSWRTDTVRLLLKFSEVDDNLVLVFYRDHYHNKQSNRGDIPLDIIDESFLIWMKNLK